jgi:hypothetical protein
MIIINAYTLIRPSPTASKDNGYAVSVKSLERFRLSRVRLLLLLTVLELILSACCPAVRSAPQTAFTATITGVSATTFKVRPSQNSALVTVELTAKTALLNVDGHRLEPDAFQTGMHIWISGTLTQNEVHAQEVQLLTR